MDKRVEEWVKKGIAYFLGGIEGSPIAIRQAEAIERIVIEFLIALGLIEKCGCKGFGFICHWLTRKGHICHLMDSAGCKPTCTDYEPCTCFRGHVAVESKADKLADVLRDSHSVITNFTLGITDEAQLASQAKDIEAALEDFEGKGE